MSRLPAFAHRNFRLFWTGNVISLIGTLGQDAARGWLVRELSRDPLVVSAIAACSSAPILLFTLYAGAVADRVHKTRGLLLTNLLALLVALMLWALIYHGAVQVWHVAVLSILAGTINAFDIPIRQSMNVEMVGRDDLPNAIALNSTAFNGARVAGPAVGGLLIHWVGTAGCFALNAASFVPLLVNLTRMRLPQIESDKRAPSLADIREGFDFVRQHPVLWPTTLLVAMCSLFAMSFSNLMPIFAKDVFHTDARGFSALLTCSGAGALASAAQLAVSGNMRHKGKRLLGGAFAFCGCVAAFAWAPNLIAGCALAMLGGYFLLTFLMTANTLVQTAAPDALRGRVFSLYSLALIGSGPFGALFVGGLAKAFNPRVAVFAGACIAATWTFGTFWKCRALWKE